MVDSDWDEDCVSVPQKQSGIQKPFHRQPELQSDRYPRRYENDYGNGFSKTITVDSKFVGKIIGKGGANIKELRAQTRTYINILDQVSDTGSSKIIIKGNEDDVCSAEKQVQKLIEELRRDSRPQRSFGSSESWRTTSTSNNNGNKSAFIKSGKIDWAMIAKSSKENEEEFMKSLVPINKIFYEEPPHIRSLTEEEVDQIRLSKHDISVRDLSGLDRPIPKVIENFTDVFSPYPEILDTIYNAKFTVPSPIQCQAWPIIMSGHDLIGIAQTGTGKTLAFLLPALIHIEHQAVPRNQRTGPSCLILSPTRELAIQIHEEVLKYNYKDIKSVCVYGGASRSDQIETIEQGAEIVIATPGRLNDLIDSGIVSVAGVTFLVLDEADRMLDLGFEPDIRKIIILIRKDRQTIMTSATWPPGVSRLASLYQKDPFQINVGSLNLTACKNVEQRVEMIKQEDKMERLKTLLLQFPLDYKVLVFVGRKITADHLSVEFTTNRICEGQVECIHGGREQYDRERALNEFKTGSARILIATDVASRGLDVCDINLVINYDFPRNIEEYVHRIGRTGRAGRFGVSLSFITREDWGSAQSLVDILKDSNQFIPDELIIMAERFMEKRREREAARFSNGGSEPYGNSNSRPFRRNRY